MVSVGTRLGFRRSVHDVLPYRPSKLVTTSIGKKKKWSAASSRQHEEKGDEVAAGRGAEGPSLAEARAAARPGVYRPGASGRWSAASSRRDEEKGDEERSDALAAEGRWKVRSAMRGPG